MSTKGKNKPTLKSGVETITPELAMEYVQKARAEVYNRDVSSAKVAKMVDDIKAGRWVLNGESICFDAEGLLADGQHRCWAVIEAGTPIESMVVRGVDRATALPTYDIGVARGLKDVIQIFGIGGRRFSEGNATISAAANWLHRYRNRLILEKPSRPSIPALRELLEKEPGLVDSCLSIGEGLRGLVTSPSLMVFCHYIFASRNADLAYEFFDKLTSGANLGMHDPVLALRKKLLEHRVDHKRRGSEQLVMVTFKAWIAAEHKMPLANIAWRRPPSEKAPGEAFPYLETLPNDPKKIRKIIGAKGLGKTKD